MGSHHVGCKRENACERQRGPMVCALFAARPCKCDSDSKDLCGGLSWRPWWRPWWRAISDERCENDRKHDAHIDGSAAAGA
eukprot:6440131-Prymnesium_polylepis.1